MANRLMNVGFRIPTNVDAEPLERTLDLRQYLNFVWRNWLFIVSVTAVAFVIGVVNLVRAVPLYTASTQVLLERHEKAPGLDAGASDSRFDDGSYLENQLAILGSDSLDRNGSRIFKRSSRFWRSSATPGLTPAWQKK